MTRRSWAALAAGAVFLAACGGSGDGGGPAIKPFTPNEPFSPDPYPSTYSAYPNAPVLITHATILDGEGAKIEDGSLLLQDGKGLLSVQVQFNAIELRGEDQLVERGLFHAEVYRVVTPVEYAGHALLAA